MDDLFNNHTLYGVVRDKNVTLQKPCSEYYMEIQFLTFINATTSDYLSMNFTSTSETANICLFSFANVRKNLFGDKTFLLEQPAFFERKLKDKIISRFRLIFRGLRHRLESVVSIRENYIITTNEVHPTREIS
jgi:hypothetical protein